MGPDDGDFDWFDKLMFVIALVIGIFAGLLIA